MSEKLNVLPHVSWPPSGVSCGNPRTPPYTSPSPPWSVASFSSARPTANPAVWWSWRLRGDTRQTNKTTRKTAHYSRRRPRAPVRGGKTETKCRRSRRLTTTLSGRGATWAYSFGVRENRTDNGAKRRAGTRLGNGRTDGRHTRIRYTHANAHWVTDTAGTGEQVTQPLTVTVTVTVTGEWWVVTTTANIFTLVTCNVRLRGRTAEATHTHTRRSLLAITAANQTILLLL